MNRKQLVMIVLALALMLTGSIQVLTATAAPSAQESSKDDAKTEESTVDDVDDEEEVELSTAGLSTTLVQPGRAIVHARGNHFVVDSVPVLGGPNEERNPVDLMLGALATCGLFIFESGAVELGMPLESLSVAVEGDMALQGLKDGSVNPRFREFRVMIDAQGLSEEDFDVLQERWQARCPAYTTFIRSAPIEVIRVNHEMGDDVDEEAVDVDEEAVDVDEEAEDQDQDEDADDSEEEAGDDEQG